MKALLLAAGLGTRLLPFTQNWPKCLMPIHKRPLLEYWLEALRLQKIDDIMVNRHHHADIVKRFINQPQYTDWVKSTYEPSLLGTAGTLRKNSDFFGKEAILLVHADNWSCCNFSDFILYHQNYRPRGTLITMMTFDCPTPETCGIVELDKRGQVTNFYEKVKNPPSKLANAAVYIIEPEVLSWINNNSKVLDFSTEVLPNFIGKIATWKNKNIHKDIGTISMLIKAQKDKCYLEPWSEKNLWQHEFMKHPIHQEIEVEIGVKEEDGR
jgi:mannose-1-phosphate guanylyltransferase